MSHHHLYDILVKCFTIIYREFLCSLVWCLCSVDAIRLKVSTIRGFRIWLLLLIR